MSRKIATVFDRVFSPELISKAVAAYHLAMRRLDSLPGPYRQGISITVSLLLHLALLLFLLPTKTGLTSLGSTGIGNLDGGGTSVTLVDASELIPLKASQPEAQPAPAEQAPETATTAETTEAVDDTAKSVPTTDAATEAKDASAPRIVESDSQALSDSTTQPTAGAHGQNGQANTDLWNAIAPCWNRIAAKDTLSTTLTISFAADGGLSVPPVIERDPNAPITDQSLQSEAKALAALAECGAYPMVSGQQNIQVVFPAPTALLSANRP